MKFKQFIPPLLIFILGVIFSIIGALFKIQHWALASEIFTLGTLTQVIALLVLMGILVKYFLKK